MSMYPQQYPQQYPPQPGQYPYGGAPYYPAPGYPPAPQGAFGGAPGQVAPPQAPRQPLAQWAGGEAFSPSRPKRTAVSFKGAQVGTRRVLLVDGLPYVVQATKWQQDGSRGEPEFWPDGNPKWVVGVPCADEYGQPAAWWVRRPSAAYRAVNEAQETQGIKIQRSRVVVVTFLREEPTNGNPQKIYSVEIYDVDTAWQGLSAAQQAVYTEWCRVGTAELEDDPMNSREDKQAAAAESASAAPQAPAQVPNAAPPVAQYPPQGYGPQPGVQHVPPVAYNPAAYPQAQGGFAAADAQRAAQIGQGIMQTVPPNWGQYGTPQPPAGPGAALAAAQQAAAARGHNVAPQQVPPGAPMTMGRDAMGPRAVPVGSPQAMPVAPAGAPLPQQAPTVVHGIPVDVLATLVGQPDTDLMALGYNVVDIHQAIEEAQRLGALPPF